MSFIVKGVVSYDLISALFKMNYIIKKFIKREYNDLSDCR